VNSPHVAKRIVLRFELNLGSKRTQLVKHLSRTLLSFCLGRLSSLIVAKSFVEIASQSTSLTATWVASSVGRATDF